jgi:hypothetical protein
MMPAGKSKNDRKDEGENLGVVAVGAADMEDAAGGGGMEEECSYGTLANMKCRHAAVQHATPHRLFPTRGGQ